MDRVHLEMNSFKVKGATFLKTDVRIRIAGTRAAADRLDRSWRSNIIKLITGSTLCRTW